MNEFRDQWPAQRIRFVKLRHRRRRRLNLLAAIAALIYFTLIFLHFYFYCLLPGTRGMR